MFKILITKFPKLAETYKPALLSLNQDQQHGLDELLKELDRSQQLNEKVAVLLCEHSKTININATFAVIDSLMETGNLHPHLMTFAITHPHLETLSHALELFCLTQKKVTDKDFATISQLATFLANPLILTIYHARIFADSDYSEPRDPLDSETANKLITILNSSSSQTDKIKHGFNLLLSLRPMPASLKYYEETRIDLDETVSYQISDYFEHKLKCSSASHSELTVNKELHVAATEGASFLFDTLKYDIAASIVREDIYSRDDYDTLMTMIARAMAKPNASLSELVAKTKPNGQHRPSFWSHGGGGGGSNISDHEMAPHSHTP